MNVLAIDVGGSHVKCLASGQSTPRELVSGPTLTAAGMVRGVLAIRPIAQRVVELRLRRGLRKALEIARTEKASLTTPQP